MKRDHLHSKAYVCPKVDEPRSILSLGVIRTRLGLCIKNRTATVTLKFDCFDLKIDRDHLHSKCMVTTYKAEHEKDFSAHHLRHT